MSANINSTHTNITRLATPSSLHLADKYANTTLPFVVGTPDSPQSSHTSYSLAIDQTLTIANRLYWQNLTYAGNLLQCQPVDSGDNYAAGQFPTAAIDGATATSWQPASNSSASITVNTTLVAYTEIKELYFSWGERPPVSATVYFGNYTKAGKVEATSEKKVNVGSITPDLPFNMTLASLSDENVVPVVGNSTTFSVTGGVWSGSYVRLEVEGCWEEDGNGATVGEFVVVGA